MRGVLGILAVLAAVGVGMAQPAFEPQDLWPYGPVYDMEYGTFPAPWDKPALMVGTGSGVRLLVQDTVAFKDTAVLRSATWGKGTDLLFLRSQQVLFLATTTALEIWSLANPLSPTLMSVTYFPQYASQVAMAWQTANNLLIVALSNYGVLIYSVADLLNPALVATAILNEPMYSVAVAGDYIYLATGYGGLYPVDITNPANPSVGSPLTTGGSVEAVSASETQNAVYVSDAILGAVYVYTLNLGSLLGTFSSAAMMVTHSALWANTLYLLDEWAGVRMLDVSDPTQPTQTGLLSVDPTTPARNLTPIGSGKILITQDNTVGIHEVDFSVDPYNPSMQPVTVSHGVLFGGTVYTLAGVPDLEGVSLIPEGNSLQGNDGDGLWKHTIQNGQVQSEPLITLPGMGAPYDLDAGPAGNLKQGDFRVVLARGGWVPNHLAVVHATTTGATLDTLELTAVPLSVRGTATHAYVGTNDGSLHVVDLSISPPSLVNTLNLPGTFVMGMDLRDTLLAVALGDSGVVLFSIADPVQPQVLGQITGMYARQVRLSDSLMFVMAVTGPYDVRIHHLDPPNLTLLSWWTYPYTAYEDASQAGHVLFVLKPSTRAGVEAIDLSDPTQPTLLATLDLPSFPQRVQAFPDAHAGAEAARAAVPLPPETGRVGVGTGTTGGK
ncbi:MAG: hypothetical protein L3J76_05505, partial [Candidatus Hydrothermae bacterium]|nr:hypothetical protein [Candidatus Hydrothermae bacterium]